MTIHVNNFLSWLSVRDVYVNDNGTWRRCKEVFVNNNGTWTRIHGTGLFDATLTAGQSSGLVGYRASIGLGSMSPTVTDDSRTVVSFYNAVFGLETDDVILEIQGFSSDPGTSWLSSVTVSGFGSLTPASAVYSYGGGTAVWTWEDVGHPFVNGGVYTIDISRNA